MRVRSHEPPPQEQEPGQGSSSSPHPCRGLALGRRPQPEALPAAHAWRNGGRQHAVPGLAGPRSHGGQGRRRQGGRQAGEEGVGSRAGGREGGRIDSLSSTGTTELSCHGERGAAGRARGGRRSHMPEGRRQQRANPTVLLLQPPPARPLGPGRQEPPPHLPQQLLECLHRGYGIGTPHRVNPVASPWNRMKPQKHVVLFPRWGSCSCFAGNENCLWDLQDPHPHQNHVLAWPAGEGLGGQGAGKICHCEEGRHPLDPKQPLRAPMACCAGEKAPSGASTHARLS
ncbi:PREDICTED: uncharacterized protein LOC102023912 [Chinchilla lanigera]|uniref:uncharacterized protein LOC102023912 n=1 Tax=Chinchilla lanigera TaxID=34839 RepID=UPI00038F0B92|nr:PREDICTED: uncharacterized protein LOC102023912 [Chinchilla lanigera]